MDLQKEREAFEKYIQTVAHPHRSPKVMFFTVNDGHGNVIYCDISIQNQWETWQAAKAQAVQEQDQQVWATSNLTWKDIAFRALSCKVLKSSENWVHVKNIACVGSTTASLICKKLGVNPDGTKFELIEAQGSAK